MQQEELRRYKEKVESEFGKCRVLTARMETTLAISNNTSENTAPKGVSWIDFWRSMTGCYESRLSCCSCGKVIYAEKVPEVMVKMYQSTGDNADNHRAIGAHMHVETPKSGNYPGGVYIAPLCPLCNSRKSEKIPVLRGTKICRELGTDSL